MGESYVMSSALKAVVEQHDPKIQITVRETGGTAENLHLLEQGHVEMATAQADVPAGPSARLVAYLYEDVFQLLVRHDLDLEGFAALPAKPIPLPRTRPQFPPF